MELSPVRYARTPDGAEVAWAEMGGGPPLLLFPGLGPGISFIEAVRRVGFAREAFEGLAGFSRVLVFDYRGVGSSPPPLPASRNDLFSDALAVADAASADSLVVMTQGLYASFALELALRHPDRVSGLVLHGPILSYGEYAPVGLTVPLTELAQRDWRLYARATLGLFDIPEEDREDLVEVGVETGSWEARSALFAIEVNAEPPAGLASLAVPVLVMRYTDDDSLVPPVIIQRAAAAIPAAQVVTIDGTWTRMVSMVEPIRRFLEEVLPDRMFRSADVSVGPRLTARELEVLGQIARGKTNAQIAEAMVITQHTVASHVKRILSKLEAGNRTEAARMGRELGLID